MRNVKCGELIFGAGLPKIAIPLTGEGIPALKTECEYVDALPGDLVEWRADCYFGNPLEAAQFVGDGVKKRPLLLTVRTEKEGGKASLSPEKYEKLLSSMMNTKLFQMVDIELSCGRERTQRLIRLAKSLEIVTVLSKHDFSGTPAEHEIFGTLREMEQLGADLPKYAVMPKNARDVLTLLRVTERASREFGPVITMSMGELGKISRVSGGYFGSCLTFASGRNPSAPGQMDAEMLYDVLRDLNPETN